MEFHTKSTLFHTRKQMKAMMTWFVIVILVAVNGSRLASALIDKYFRPNIHADWKYLWLRAVARRDGLDHAVPEHGWHHRGHR